MSTDNSFDAYQAEKNEINTLIEQGVVFTTKKRSLLRFFGKKDRSFLLQQPYLGTLDFLSHEFIQMGFSEDKVKADPLGESKRLIEQNAKRCGRVIAIAILNSEWKIKLFTGLFAKYLIWHITPTQLFQLTMIINSISNVADFTNSIRFLSVNRTTTPTLMETPEKQPV